VNRKLITRLARYGTPATIVIVLLAAFRLYTYTYFWLDDFGIVYGVRREGFWRLLWDVVNPVSLFFRPLGMLVYWIVFQIAGLNPVPYHLLSWMLHAVNTALVFLLLRKAASSHYAAGLAVLFFAFRSNFGDIYYSFANIFQLLAFTLVLIGILLYIRFGYSRKETLALTAVYLLAIRAEEQAVMLPILWFAYEWLIRRNVSWRRLLVRYSMFALVMAWFALFKLTTMPDVDPTRPYYLDVSATTFGHGYGWYFNSLYQTDLHWGVWFTISILLAIAFGISRIRWGLFFLIFMYTTLLPYVFLVNHRFELYWYMPFVGAAGILALGIAAVQQLLGKILPREAYAAVLSLVFTFIAVRNFRYEEHRGRIVREWTKGIADEYRDFMRDLRSLPDAATVPTLYYTAVPRHMDEASVTNSTQFALNRTDIDTKVVENCPAEGACVEFRDGHLRRLR